MAIEQVFPILDNHIRRYPGFASRDAYKLLHQRYMGPMHACLDRDMILKFLLDELKSLRESDEISLVETLATDFFVVRIYLAPFKKLKLDPEKLASTFLESATSFKQDKPGFVETWKELIDKVTSGYESQRLKDISEIDQLAMENDYGPMHHSRQYQIINNPAYRVVLRDILIRAFPAMKNQNLWGNVVD